MQFRFAFKENLYIENEKIIIIQHVNQHVNNSFINLFLI